AASVSATLSLHDALPIFYPSVYTHSLAWAIHGKRTIRNGGKGKNRRDMKFVGNRLDKLFQMANDGCTNGLPIGPAVSDIVSEIRSEEHTSALRSRANLVC